jgi:hypothetical protein
MPETQACSPWEETSITIFDGETIGKGPVSVKGERSTRRKGVRRQKRVQEL